MNIFCCDDNRRAAVRALAPFQGREPLNGIDHLEVVDLELKDTADDGFRQRRLRVYFVRPPADHQSPNPPPFLRSRLAGLTSDNIRLDGGGRIQGIRATPAFKPVNGINGSPDPLDHLLLELDQAGDYSNYTLRLVEPNGKVPLVELDPELASITFSFKVECPSDFDCAPVCGCPPTVAAEPELDYLARDYSSFRQLMLDRLSLVAPNWRERNPADLGIALIELLAYVGDHISYRQDAIATEAYLGTARQRVSVRRHARLLDYPLHEGCNARVWVQVRLKRTSETVAGVRLYRLLRFGAQGLGPPDPDETLVPSKDLSLRLTRFTTLAGDSPWLPAEPAELDKLLTQTKPEIFEPLEDAALFAAHNEFRFHTWGEERCHLPRGATKATLSGSYGTLAPGMVLVLAEVKGPHTASPSDADPGKRHAVRLTNVRISQADNPTQLLRDPIMDVALTEIEWGDDDALPFPLCLSSVAESGPEAGRQVTDVTVALGNIILADHGLTVLAAEKVGTVPEPNPALAPVLPNACGPCTEEDDRLAPVRFRPRLASPGLTFAQPFDRSVSASDPNITSTLPAAATAFALEPHNAMPAATLGANGQLWEPFRDLLGSEAFDRHFVVEMENDGRAMLRFGDDANGQQPSAGTEFYALYRLGSGPRGNVGADSIIRISAPAFFTLGGQRLNSSAANLIERVSNPLPARGGMDPETLEEVRQYAPQAFRTPKRCVTPADYAERAAQHPAVQRAAASIRWTGSWHTIFLTVDRKDARPVDTGFEDELRLWLEPFRLAGHDLEVNAPEFVSLEIVLFACVADGYFRSDVKGALLDVFSTRQRPDGSRGFFHPDQWTFGQPLWLSKVAATAQNVAGVRWVEVRILRRQGSSDTSVPSKLSVGDFEILRLENDPAYPDHGQLTILTAGGR